MEIISEHWILSIIVTIVLGALGSGLWESVFRPVFKGLGIAIFKLLTFGAKGASNRIYKEAAKGHHDQPSIFIMVILITSLIGFYWGTTIGIYTASNLDQVKFEVMEKCDKLNSETAIKECKKQEIRNYVFSNAPYLFLGLIFFGIILLYQCIHLIFVNVVITNYHQTLRILGVHLTQEERLKIEQKFALMKTKNDYINIENDFARIALENNLAIKRLTYSF